MFCPARKACDPHHKSPSMKSQAILCLDRRKPHVFPHFRSAPSQLALIKLLSPKQQPPKPTWNPHSYIECHRTYKSHDEWRSHSLMIIGSCIARLPAGNIGAPYQGLRSHFDCQLPIFQNKDLTGGGTLFADPFNPGRILGSPNCSSKLHILTSAQQHLRQIVLCFHPPILAQIDPLGNRLPYAFLE
ncbi:hypothetical protein VP01_801g5 [Puccinia sorghi]|uniref:Uncharacterized protein n=1 Tax=Puccinia sorghi TaxID=27349 RepID=A0A0L6UBA7_9BASI|nr:hypothetical protein VP01_801g5 [Puccinia sorghi]